VGSVPLPFTASFALDPLAVQRTVIGWIVVGLTIVAVLFYVVMFIILGAGAIASEGY